MSATLPKRKPVWRYGFQWTVPEAFKVARTVSKSTNPGDVWPPLPVNCDIDRDVDRYFPLTPGKHARRTAEATRACKVFQWAQWFLDARTEVDGIGRDAKTVHTGLTGSTDVSTRIIVLASARAWHLEDIKMEQLAHRLPKESVINTLREYLGEPKWFLDWDYVWKSGLLKRLESGELQKLLGIAVDTGSLATPDALTQPSETAEGSSTD